MLLVVNLGEEQVKDAAALPRELGPRRRSRRRPGFALCPVAAPIEAEMAQLSAEDAQAFREDLGLAEPGLDRVIRTSYALLGLISFLTAGEDECRAWTIRQGTQAPAGGGRHPLRHRARLHPRRGGGLRGPRSAAGSLAACREKGTLRLEGKEYVVRDGDVINFRFNV